MASVASRPARAKDYRCRASAVPKLGGSAVAVHKVTWPSLVADLSMPRAVSLIWLRAEEAQTNPSRGDISKVTCSSEYLRFIARGRRLRSI
jgi:hypothetical protein